MYPRKRKLKEFVGERQQRRRIRERLDAAASSEDFQNAGQEIREVQDHFSNPIPPIIGKLSDDIYIFLSAGLYRDKFKKKTCPKDSSDSRR